MSITLVQIAVKTMQEAFMSPNSADKPASLLMDRFVPLLAALRALVYVLCSQTTFEKPSQYTPSPTTVLSAPPTKTLPIQKSEFDLMLLAIVLGSAVAAGAALVASGGRGGRGLPPWPPPPPASTLKGRRNPVSRPNPDDDDEEPPEGPPPPPPASTASDDPTNPPSRGFGWAMILATIFVGTTLLFGVWMTFSEQIRAFCRSVRSVIKKAVNDRELRRWLARSIIALLQGGWLLTHSSETTARSNLAIVAIGELATAAACIVGELWRRSSQPTIREPAVQVDEVLESAVGVSGLGGGVEVEIENAEGAVEGGAEVRSEALGEKEVKEVGGEVGTLVRPEGGEEKEVSPAGLEAKVEMTLEKLPQGSEEDSGSHGHDSEVDTTSNATVEFYDAKPKEGHCENFDTAGENDDYAREDEVIEMVVSVDEQATFQENLEPRIISLEDSDIRISPEQSPSPVDLFEKTPLTELEDPTRNDPKVIVSVEGNPCSVIQTPEPEAFEFEQYLLEESQTKDDRKEEEETDSQENACRSEQEPEDAPILKTSQVTCTEADGGAEVETQEEIERRKEIAAGKCRETVSLPDIPTSEYFELDSVFYDLQLNLNSSILSYHTFGFNEPGPSSCPGSMGHPSTFDALVLDAIKQSYAETEVTESWVPFPTQASSKPRSAFNPLAPVFSPSFKSTPIVKQAVPVFWAPAGEKCPLVIKEPLTKGQRRAKRRAARIAALTEAMNTISDNTFPTGSLLIPPNSAIPMLRPLAKRQLQRLQARDTERIALEIIEGNVDEETPTVR